MDYTRQRDWFDPDRTNASVTIVGCGGIGSFTALALAKLGVQRLTLVDYDVVEEHNIPNQLFGHGDLGLTKVRSLADISDVLGGEAKWDCRDHRLQDGVPLSDVVISALDSMHARKDLWELVKGKPQCRLFLDARLAGQAIVLYAVRPMNPDDQAGYEATLYSDKEAADDPCTARAVIDVGFAVASLLTRAVRKHYAREEPTPTTYWNQDTLNVYKGEWDR